MGLKDNLNAVKQEIGTEEQFLESIIKGERFFKRYKKYIIVSIIAVVVAGVSYTTMNFLNENRLTTSNDAYAKLLINPDDSKSLNILKEKNEKLYNFYRFQIALKNQDLKVLKELSEFKSDPIISDLSAYQLSGLENKEIKQSELLSGFVYLQEGYKLLLENKISEAKIKFAQIDLNSPLKNISKNLEHYQGKKSKGNN